VNDHIDPATREWVTVDEDGNMVFPEVSEAKAGQLGARFEAWLLARETALTPEQVRWLTMIGSQLRANADTLDEFTEGHLAFHPFTLMGGVQEARRVFNGEGKLQRILDDLNLAVFRSSSDDHTGGETERPSASN